MRSLSLLVVLSLSFAGCEDKKPAPSEPAAPPKAAAPAAGGNTCEANYAVMNEYAQASGKPFTPRDEFLAGCQALPEPLQRCANIDYQMKNMMQCSQELAKDKAAEARFKEIMKKRE